MKNLPLYLTVIATILVLFAIVSLILFVRYKILLRKANLVTFKKVLGGNYQFRTQTNGLIKYKWKVMFMMVKASFDNQGQVKEWKIKLFRFFPQFQRRFAAW